MGKYRFSVLVGDGEVNDSLLTYEEAVEVAEAWIDKGYGLDTIIDEYLEGTPEGKHRYLKLVLG